MKKGITAVFIAIILMTNLSGCGQKSGHDIYEGIYKRYTNLNSFYAEVEVIVLGDKLKSVYLGRQFYEAPDKFSFEVDSPQEVSGSGYTLKGGKVLLRSGLGDQKVLDVSFPREKNTIFLCDFFEEYYKSEETFIETAKSIYGETTVLSLYLPGKSEKRFMQSLKIDNKTYLPLELTTYDINKNPVVIVRFGEFKGNCDIDQRIFDSVGDKS